MRGARVYTAFFAGTELIMPQMFLQGAPILTMIRELRPTISLGVPTIWNDVLRVAETDDRRRHVEPSRHPRGRLRSTARHDRNVPRSLRHRAHPGLGHDRDQPARGGLHSPRRAPPKSSTSTIAQRRVAWWRAWSCASCAEDGTDVAP